MRLFLLQSNNCIDLFSDSPISFSFSVQLHDTLHIRAFHLPLDSHKKLCCIVLWGDTLLVPWMCTPFITTNTFFLEHAGVASRVIWIFCRTSDIATCTLDLEKTWHTLCGVFNVSLPQSALQIRMPCTCTSAAVSGWMFAHTLTTCRQSNCHSWYSVADATQGQSRAGLVTNFWLERFASAIRLVLTIMVSITDTSLSSLLSAMHVRA